MKLSIKKNEDKIIIRFANEKLEIFDKSEQWTTEGINTFLIKLSSQTPDDQKIELEFDEEDKNKIYQHIVDLFKNFVNEYNLSIY